MPGLATVTESATWPPFTTGVPPSVIPTVRSVPVGRTTGVTSRAELLPGTPSLPFWTDADRKIVPWLG